MIFKIIMDFDNLIEIIDILKDKFDVFLLNNQMFIFAKNLKKYSVNSIKKIIKADNAFITIIDETNLRKESDKVISWCKDKFVENDLLRYEKENQKKIQEINTILDRFEENLEKIYNERM